MIFIIPENQQSQNVNFLIKNAANHLKNRLTKLPNYSPTRSRNPKRAETQKMMEKKRVANIKKQHQFPTFSFKIILRLFPNPPKYREPTYPGARKNKHQKKPTRKKLIQTPKMADSQKKHQSDREYIPIIGLLSLPPSLTGHTNIDGLNRHLFVMGVEVRHSGSLGDADGLKGARVVRSRVRVVGLVTHASLQPPSKAVQ